MFKQLFILFTLVHFLLSSTSLWSKPLSTQSQINDLKKNIEELQKTIEKQNAKIEELTQNQKNETSSQPPPSETAKNQKETRSFGPLKYEVSSTAAKMLPDISVVGALSGAVFQNDPSGGDEAHGHDPHRTGFNLQEIELGIQSVIDPYVRGDIFLSFHEDGVELEEAYLTTLNLPKGLQIRAGKYKVPFGRQNQKHLETWAFINNNLTDKTLLGPEGFNELGVELSYLFPTPFFLQAQFSFNQGENKGNFDGERRQDFVYTGRLSASASLSDHTTLLAGASGALGYNNSANGKMTQLVGGDLLIKWKPSPNQSIEWQSEYIYKRKNIVDGLETEGGISSYLLGNWSKYWGAGLRAEYMGLPVETEKVLRISPILHYRPSEFLRFKLQGDMTRHIGDKTEFSGLLQMIFNMGPHGAHQF